MLGAAAVMYCIEFFADKVPGVDTGWDTLHTFVRIPAGFADRRRGRRCQRAGGVRGHAGRWFPAATSHAAKAGSRVVINASPEPFTNWAASITEDVTVVAGLWAAHTIPGFSGGIAGVHLVDDLAAAQTVGPSSKCFPSSAACSVAAEAVKVEAAARDQPAKSVPGRCDGRLNHGDIHDRCQWHDPLFPGLSRWEANRRRDGVLPTGVKIAEAVSTLVYFHGHNDSGRLARPISVSNPTTRDPRPR